MTRPLFGRLLGPLLLATLTLAMWGHRIHIDQPMEKRLLVNGDVHLYFHPAAHFIQDEYRDGRVPLWNPYQLAGQPYLALHVPGVLYPSTVLFLLAFPPEIAQAANAVLHIFLAGLFVYLWTGRLGWGRASRVASSVTYMFCGPLLFGIYMTQYLLCEAWLPAVLWTLNGLLSDTRPRWAIGLAASLTMTFLTGWAQASLFIVQVGVLYGLFGLFFIAAPGRRWQAIGLAGAAGALALAWMGPQLLPAAELASQAVRGFDGLPLSLAQRPFIWRSVLLEGMLGHLTGRPELFDPSPGWWAVVYPVLGLPLIALAVFGRRQRAHAVAFLLAWVGSALFVIPQGIFPLYFGLPGGDLFRGPARLGFVYMFTVAVLVGLGLEAVRQLLGARARTARLARPIVAGLAALVVVDMYSLTSLDFTHPILGESPEGTLAAVRRDRESRPGHPRIFLERGRRPWVPAKLGMVDRVPVVPDYEPSMPAVYRAFFAAREQPPWHGGLSILDRPEDQTAEAQLRRLDLMSVQTYALPVASGGAKLAELHRLVGTPPRKVGEFWLLHRLEAVPRAYAVSRAERLPTVDDVLAAILEPSFDPTTSAYLHQGKGLAGPVGPDGAGSVDIQSLEPQRVVLLANCREPCLVVLTDLDYPGWEARVGGVAQEILTVNGLFRGVLLPPGQHELEYRFRPWSFAVGVALAASGGAAALLWLLATRRRSAT